VVEQAVVEVAEMVVPGDLVAGEALIAVQLQQAQPDKDHPAVWVLMAVVVVEAVAPLQSVYLVLVVLLLVAMVVMVCKVLLITIGMQAVEGVVVTQQQLVTAAKVAVAVAEHTVVVRPGLVVSVVPLAETVLLMEQG
jgi:hypothetical protein